MGNKLGKTWLGVAGVVVCGLTGAAVAFGAGAANTTNATTTGTTASSKPAHTPETPLTGDVATNAKAAAATKVGGTADSATTENDSSDANAAYEVHVTKADGTHLTVILDANDNVLSVENGHGPDGHGHRGQGETPLTGDIDAKAKAAALAKVGGTADSATTENDKSNANAAYEVHVTKADGTHIEVILDSSYGVLAVETHQRGPDHGGPHG